MKIIKYTLIGTLMCPIFIFCILLGIPVLVSALLYSNSYIVLSLISLLLDIPFVLYNFYHIGKDVVEDAGKD